MNMLTAAFEVITRMAPTADREALVALDAKRRTLDSAAKVAIALGAMDDQTLLDTGSAHVAAQEAIQFRFGRLEAEQLDIIRAVPRDRRSRTTLQPAATPADLGARLDHIEHLVTYAIREQGTPLHVLRDGVAVGRLDAYDITIGGGRIALGTNGTFELAGIAATSIDEDHDHFGILLSDGTLLEIQEDKDFVWVDPSAAKAA